MASHFLQSSTYHVYSGRNALRRNITPIHLTAHRHTIGSVQVECVDSQDVCPDATDEVVIVEALHKVAEIRLSLSNQLPDAYAVGRTGPLGRWQLWLPSEAAQNRMSRRQAIESFGLRYSVNPLSEA